jgi:hypothetical protein
MKTNQARRIRMTTPEITKPADGPVREQIVRAARACFLRFGTEKTSMSDVAKAANLSPEGVAPILPGACSRETGGARIR